MNFCHNHSQTREKFCLRCKLFFCSCCTLCSHAEIKKIPKFLLANYTLSKILGNVCCFKAIDPKNEKNVYAIYVLENFNAKSEGDFINMVNRGNIFDNDNLLKIHDYHIDEGMNCLIIMTDFAEKNLKNLALSLDQNKAVAIMLKLCETIDFLHKEMKLMHGEIRLKNILVQENNLKITNFWSKPQKKIIIFGPPEILRNPEKTLNENSDIWSLGVIFHKLLAKNANPFLNYNYDGPNSKAKIRENILEDRIFMSPCIKNAKLCKIIKECLTIEMERIPLIEIIKILKFNSISYPLSYTPTDFQFLKQKYNLKKDYPFAIITLHKFTEFNEFFLKTLPESLSGKNFLSITIFNSSLKVRENECGLTYSDSQKLTLLLNSSFISEANIAGIKISIDPPWYPFEYDFRNQKGTDTAKNLLECIFNNNAFEVFGLILKCKYEFIDNRCAVNLTQKEAEDFCDILSKNNNTCNIKNIYLEFDGDQGALGITEYVCMEVVYGIMKSDKIDNVIFKVKGNKKNGFGWKSNKNVEINFNLLRKCKKNHKLTMIYE